MQNTKFKKILFLGLGGAGQRHLRIFSKYFHNKDFAKYAYRFKKKTPFLDKNFKPNNKKLKEVYKLKILKSFQQAVTINPDIIFISTPSSIRYILIKNFKKNKQIFFVEKPLAISIKELNLIKKHVKKYKQRIAVLFQKRFHPHNILTIKKIKEGFFGKILFVKFITKSFMPHWHTYENFRKLYAAKKNLGGGVVLTECHEIDLCLHFFGKPIKYNIYLAKREKYKLDIYDQAKIYLKYKKFNVLIEIDFLNKNTERSYHIFGTKNFVISDQVTNIYKYKNYRKFYKLNNDYLFIKQLKYFMLLSENKNFSEANTSSAKTIINLANSV